MEWMFFMCLVANSVMSLDRIPVQLAWRPEGRQKSRRECDKDISTHTKVYGPLRNTISFVFLVLGSYFSFSGMRFYSNSRWEQKMSSLGWVGKTLPQPAVKIWWWVKPVSPILSLCPFSEDLSSICPSWERVYKHQGVWLSLASCRIFLVI